MSEKRLLLWDIDGTLISTGAAGQHAIVRATAERFGGKDDLSGVEIAGRTDIGIAHQIFEKYAEPATAENIDSFLDLYVRLLAEELPRRQGRVLRGELDLLQRAAQQSHTTLGILTANQGSLLSAIAFADDHPDRNELGAFALSRAQQTTGIDFAPEQVDVIGDTGHDIACGKAFGARTIAVATGSWSRQRLTQCEPDFLFDDLANVDEVKRILGW